MVDFIKFENFSRSIAILILTCLFLSIAGFSTTADENNAIISIVGDPVYELVSRDTTNDITISRYFINITFGNTGTETSDEIRVNLTDEEGFSLTKDFTLSAGAETTVSFYWSTTYYQNQNIVVKFFPKDLDTDWTEDNSGSTTFELVMIEGEDNKSTPGFEIILVLSAIIIFAYYQKQKRKK